MPRLLAIHVRLGDAQLHRADLVQAGFQRAVQQLVQLVQLAQGNLHLTHRPVALQHRLAGFQVIVFRLGAQVGGADVFLLDVVFLQEIKVLRHALVHLLLRLGGVFGGNAHFDRQGGDIRRGVHAGGAGGDDVRPFRQFSRLQRHR